MAKSGDGIRALTILGEIPLVTLFTIEITIPNKVYVVPKLA
jgi:hypothetical protein